VRLGRLLGAARQTSGETLDDLVRRCGLAYEADFFAGIEAGEVALDESLVRWLAQVYGVESGVLVPARARLIIDLDEGHVAIGEQRIEFDAADPDAILRNYLALLYLLRGLPVGTPIPLRNADLGVLSDALRVPVRDVSLSLGKMMSAHTDVVREHARGLHRRLVVPVAGILVGFTAVGGLLLVRSDGAGAAGDAPGSTAPEVGAAVGVPVAVGDAVVLERSSTSDNHAQQTVRQG
jgi:hypothetical protein